VLCCLLETTSFGDDEKHETSFGDEKTSFRDESSYTMLKIDLHVSKLVVRSLISLLLPLPCAGSVRSGGCCKMLREGRSVRRFISGGGGGGRCMGIRSKGL
jgi:hypothetical protein